MTSRHAATLAVWGLGLCAAAAVLKADTLIMRDGRRLQGDLVSMRDGIIEFDGPRGRIRVDRREVTRVELDDDYRGNSFDAGSGAGRPAGLRERDVTVNANAAWRDSGVMVRAGQTIYFSASGRVDRKSVV